MDTAVENPLPYRTLDGFVPASYTQGKRDVLSNGLRALQRIHSNLAFEDWMSVLNAFTQLTQDVCTEIGEEDFRGADTEKGSPFQRRFTSRWERYESLVGSNYRPLSKQERSALRFLVKEPAVLTWYASLAEKPTGLARQRQMTHPNRIVAGWKAATQGKPAGTEESAAAKLKLAEEKIRHLEHRLTTEGSRFDILRDTPKDIARVFLATCADSRTTAVAREMLAAVKARKAPAG